MGKPRDPRREDEIRKLVADGLATSEIATALGIHVVTVRRIRKHLGIPPRSYPAYPKSVRLKAVEMLDEGMSYVAVGQALGISYATVADWYPGRGWTPKQVAEHVSLLKKYAYVLDIREGWR